MRYCSTPCKIRPANAGFTIIEFVIATAAFSIILLIMVTVITYFMVNYYKVKLSSSVETSLSQTVGEIDQAVELSASAPNATTPPSIVTGSGQTCPEGDLGSPPNCVTPGYFCAGDQEYAFFLGDEVPSEAPYALYQLEVPDGSCEANPEYYDSTFETAWANGRSLFGDNYRLINFSVEPISGTSEYAIDIKVAYTSGGVNNAGDDLLCSPSISSGAGSCASGSPNLTNFSLPDIVCKGMDGSQFCDVTSLHTTVGAYVNN